VLSHSLSGRDSRTAERRCQHTLSLAPEGQGDRPVFVTAGIQDTKDVAAAHADTGTILTSRSPPSLL
jgi:hypothetical protein